MRGHLFTPRPSIKTSLSFPLLLRSSINTPLSLSSPSFSSSSFSLTSPSSSTSSSSLFFLRFLRSICSKSSPSSSSMAIFLPPRSKTPSLLGVASNELGISRRSWNKSERDFIFSLFTPFVISLAAGNLHIETFRHYIFQDVQFLKAFSRAYELSEECADDDDDKIAITELRKKVLEELKLHDSLAQEWGTDIGKESSCTSATQKYTDFLLATASGKVEGVKGLGKLGTPFEKTKIAAYTLGAMTPCMKAYAFLGKMLQSMMGPDAGSHPYKQWIDSYSSDGFQASAQQIEDLLDKLSASLTGEELDVIEKLYKQAMKLEAEFFNAQPLRQKTVTPLCKGVSTEECRIMLFSDFDLTCTVVDSSAILAEIGILTAPKSIQNPSDSESLTATKSDQNPPESVAASKSDQNPPGSVTAPKSDPNPPKSVTAPKPDPNPPESETEGQSQIARMPYGDLRNTWDVLSRKYTDEYERCIETILATEKESMFHFDALKEAVELLADFEKRANSRVIDSGVLRGLNIEAIKKAGERIILQDGCTTFFQNFLQKENLDADVHVLSYCWCGDLIRSAFSSGGLNALNIHTNEFIYEESISTGEIIIKVESPLDKLQTFNEILTNDGNDKKTVSVYIGDSVGDVLCLLTADIGIVVGSSSSLKRLGNHFGVSFVPLFEGLIQKQRECVEGSLICWKTDGVLYTANSWSEIHAFILGC